MTLDTMDRIRTGWLTWEKNTNDEWHSTDPLRGKPLKAFSVSEAFEWEVVFVHNWLQFHASNKTNAHHARAIALISEGEG